MSKNDLVRIEWWTGDVSFVPRDEYNDIMREHEQIKKREQRAREYAKKHGLTFASFEECRDVADNSVSVHDVTEKNSLLDLLHKAKRLLTDGERELTDALYSDEDELSVRQFAEETGWSKSTIHTRHHEVIEKLRKLMDIDKL